MEVNDGTTEAPTGPDSAHRCIGLLVIAHHMIAVVPVTLGLVTFSQYSLPFIWAVSSVPFAQIMLLSMWIGLAQGELIQKLTLAVLSVVYISFWHALGTTFLGGIGLLHEIVRDCLMMMALMAVLSAGMLGVRRWLGRIQHFSDPALFDASAQYRYSLFTVLIATTAAAFFMALFRISMQKSGTQSSTAIIAHILLMMTALFLLLIFTIWGTLAPGIVRYRIIAISVLAVLLGISLAVSAGNTPANGGWWMLAGATVIVVVPSAIVCGSLLFLRAGGYRLVKMPVASCPSK